MYWVWELISIHEILSATKYAALFDKPIKQQHVISILWSRAAEWAWQWLE